jgi:tellurium resistance protein TerD
MSALQLNLTKPGDSTRKLNLSLDKGERFKVRLSWDGKTDLDLHALVAVNMGAGAKVSSMDDILSPYNVQRTIRGQTVGTLPKAANGTFQVYGGALVHSPDATDGNLEGDDEYVTIQPGQSLWQLAVSLAPASDPRDVIAEIVSLNQLSTDSVQAGQRLALPVGS